MKRGVELGLWKWMRAFHARGNEQKQRQKSVVCILGILGQKFQGV